MIYGYGFSEHKLHLFSGEFSKDTVPTKFSSPRRLLECAVSKLAGTRSSSRCSARGGLAANVVTNCDFAHAEQII